MIYELMGRAHAALARERGQGTVEYVGLVLLMAVLIAGVVKASGGVLGHRRSPRRSSSSSRRRSTASGRRRD